MVTLRANAGGIAPRNLGHTRSSGVEHVVRNDNAAVKRRLRSRVMKNGNEDGVVDGAVGQIGVGEGHAPVRR